MKYIIFILLFFPSIVLSKETIMECDIGYILILKHKTNLFGKHKLFVRTLDLKWRDLKVAYEQHGLEYTIVRPHNFYGVNQNIWDKYRNVLGIWMYQHLNGMDIFLHQNI